MDELVRQISEKTGIPESAARTAVEMVVRHLKDKLPEPLAAHVDSALGLAGSAVGGLDVGNIAGSLGGLFGGKR